MPATESVIIHIDTLESMLDGTYAPPVLCHFGTDNTPTAFTSPQVIKGPIPGYPTVTMNPPVSIAPDIDGYPGVRLLGVNIDDYTPVAADIGEVVFSNGGVAQFRGIFTTKYPVAQGASALTGVLTIYARSIAPV